MDTFKKAKTLPFANMPMASATALFVIFQLRSTNSLQNNQKAPCRHPVCDLDIVMINKKYYRCELLFLFWVYLNKWVDCFSELFYFKLKEYYLIIDTDLCKYQSCFK